MSQLKYDLHCHSNISDGLLPPEEVAARAKANGVDVWALTDHDELGGVARARAAARALGLHHVAGVEISVTWAGRTVHIVGLRVDDANPALVAGLDATRHGREHRAHDIAAELAKAGIDGAFEGALRHADNPELISRTHFARHLVESGHCCDTKDAFARFLTEGKPGYVPHRWASLRDAVAWITGAGGVAVIAHPGRYNYTETQFGALFDEFKQFGGQAIEVHTGSHTTEQYAEYAQVARRYGFLASMGSDFHGPGESRVELGALPPLPAGLKPVWHDWGL